MKAFKQQLDAYEGLGTMKHSLAQFSGLLLLLLAASAQAVVIPYGSRAAYDAAHPGAVIETWDGLATGTVIPDGSSVGPITYSTSTAGSALVTSAFVPSTTPNTLGDTVIGFFDVSDTVTFSFATPIISFGIDINTFATAAGSYLVLTDIGDVVGSVFDPFPGFETGQFLGFDSTLPFMSVTISATTATYTLDTMRAVSSVPEPATLLLLGLGLVGLGFARKRRH